MVSKHFFSAFCLTNKINKNFLSTKIKKKSFLTDIKKHTITFFLYFLNHKKAVNAKKQTLNPTFFFKCW